MQRLRGFDAAFLHFETPTNHLHVGQTRVLDPSTAPTGHSFDAARLAAVPISLRGEGDRSRRGAGQLP